MTKRIETTLGIYEPHDNYIIVTINEGINVDAQYAPEIIKILNEEMHKPFGWISNKINSYSADPFIILEVLPNVPLISSYCGVVFGKPSRDYTKYAKRIVPEDFPMASFDKLDDAIKWTIDMVRNNEHI